MLLVACFLLLVMCSFIYRNAHLPCPRFCCNADMRLSYIHNPFSKKGKNLQI